MITTTASTILTVDDDEATRYAVTRILRRAGFTVQEAKTGSEALRLAQESPALILLDVNLPDIDGFEVCRRLKTDPRTASIPVLHLSATCVHSENKVHGLEGGADGYLTGDVEPEELLATIKAFLRARQVEEALRRSEAQYRAIFERALDAIVVLDDAGLLVQVNPAACALFGLSQEELTGRRLADFIAPGEDVTTVWRTLRETGQATGELLLLRPDQARRSVRYAVTAQVIPGQHLLLFHDITERKHAEEALRQRTAELQRSNDELQQFAHVVSHDLQEPLRTVRNYVQLLARRYRGRLDADADAFISYAVEGSTHMQQLIEALLAYARVGSRGQSPVETAGEAVLAQVVEDLRAVIHESGAEVTHEPLPTVKVDQTQFRRVLQNLLGNALKFRREVPPRIHVSARRQGPEWVFAVRDNGIGIAPQHTQRIFQVFQRLHTRGQYAGTGIGLAICKRIVEQHGGRLWVESDPGKGSTFFFTIPA